MPTVKFASRLKKDGSLRIPQEAVDELGIQPGDEVQVSVQSTSDATDQAYYDQAIAELLEQARSLKSEPGKPGLRPR